MSSIPRSTISGRMLATSARNGLDSARSVAGVAENRSSLLIRTGMFAATCITENVPRVEYRACPHASASYMTSLPVETVAVHRATVSRLVRYLDPEVPWVWILNHMPCSRIAWWNSRVPLNDTGAYFQGEIRLLRYDLQLATGDFLSRCVDFDDQGISLIQSRNRMPDSLIVDRLEGTQRQRVLALNGAFLSFDLPHAGETAVVCSYSPGYLRRFEGT
jgi:hypothetical protein